MKADLGLNFGCSITRGVILGKFLNISEPVSHVTNGHKGILSSTRGS